MIDGVEIIYHEKKVKSIGAHLQKVIYLTDIHETWINHSLLYERVDRNIWCDDLSEDHMTL